MYKPRRGRPIVANPHHLYSKRNWEIHERVRKQREWEDSVVEYLRGAGLYPLLSYPMSELKQTMHGTTLPDATTHRNSSLLPSCWGHTMCDNLPQCEECKRWFDYIGEGQTEGFFYPPSHRLAGKEMSKERWGIHTSCAIVSDVNILNDDPCIRLPPLYTESEPSEIHQLVNAEISRAYKSATPENRMRIRELLGLEPAIIRQESNGDNGDHGKVNDSPTNREPISKE